MPLIARHSKNIINHVALKTVGSKLSLISYLWIIFVPILREVYNRLLDEFQVANTTHNDS